MSSDGIINSLRMLKAVRNFSTKFNRFDYASPNGKPSPKIRDEEIAQRKVDDYDQSYKIAISAAYRKYRFPYKTMGQNSSAADELVKDQERLLSAYKLHKAILEANAEFGRYETRIIDNVIVTPLTLKDQYTTGDDFVYLQCWLYYEKHARDFIPYMDVESDGVTYKLKFANVNKYSWAYKDKELFAVIQQVFYPNEDSIFQ